MSQAARIDPETGNIVIDLAATSRYILAQIGTLDFWKNFIEMVGRRIGKSWKPLPFDRKEILRQRFKPTRVNDYCTNHKNRLIISGWVWGCRERTKIARLIYIQNLQQ